jgi:hypothetical protein
MEAWRTLLCCLDLEIDKSSWLMIPPLLKVELTFDSKQFF